MARFGPKGRVEEATQVPMFACIALFVVAGFYFSFQAGASTEVRPKTLPHESLQLQHKLLREKLSDCKTKLNEHEGSSQKRSQRSHALHEKNTKLTTEEQQLNSKLLDCHYQKEDQQSKWSEEDKLNAGLVQSLSEKRDGVKGNASHLTKTRGMQHVLLDYSLTKLKRENSLLRESLGLERTTEADSEFYDNLVAKWHAKMNATGIWRASFMLFLDVNHEMDCRTAWLGHLHHSTLFTRRLCISSQLFFQIGEGKMEVGDFKIAKKNNTF